MSMLDAGNIILGLLSGGMQYGMGMEDRNEWRKRTDEAMASWDGLRSSLFEGGEGYGGILDIANLFNPQFQGFSQGVGEDVAGLSGNIGGGFQDLYNSLTGFAGEKGQELQAGYRDLANTLLPQFNTMAGDLTGAYADRTATAMGYVDQMGQQQRKDIDKSIADQRSRTQSDMISSGMGGSTVGAVMDRGITESQNDAYGRLNEMLLGNKLDTYGQFTGDELSNKQWLGSMGLDLQQGLGNAALGAKERGDMWQGNMGQTIGLDKLSSLAGIGQYGIGAGMDADMWSLGQQYNLSMLPHQMNQYLTEGKVGSSLNFGLPPEVMNPFMYMQQSLQPMYQRQIAAAGKPDRPSPFSLGATIGL